MHRLPARRDRRAQQEPETEFPGGGEGHEHHGDRRDLQVGASIKHTRVVLWTSAPKSVQQSTSFTEIRSSLFR